MNDDADVSPDGRFETRRHLATFINTFFFLMAGFSSLWLLLLAVLDTRSIKWLLVVYLVLLWAIIAYVFLPRLYRLMSALFSPDYFVGRARTNTGILGDPVNIALDGPADNIHRAMRAAGWSLSEPITLASSLRIVASVLTHSSDPNAPVSPLFLFGRQQDFAYQKQVDGSASKRHHIRFWRCPPGWPLPGGRRVEWLATSAFDTGVKLSSFTLQVTHQISGDVDAERDYTIESLRGIDPDLTVTQIDRFSSAYHMRNGGGDLMHTDGDLPIVDLTELPGSVPDLPAAEREAPDEAAVATTLRELRRTRRPRELYLSTVLIALGIATTVRSIIAGTADYPGYSGAVAAIYLVAAVALYQGYASARWLLLLTTGFDVLAHMVAWVRADFAVDAHTGVTHVAIAVLLLLILSSDAVTQYTGRITEWRLSRRANRTARPGERGGAGSG